MNSNDNDIVWDVPTPSERPRLLNAVRQVESGGNPNAVSPVGAEGPYQFMPATARALGVANPRDETQARAGADRYLSRLTEQFGGDEDLALLAYNWGPGNVQAFLRTGKGMRGQPIPLEAQQYVAKVRAAQGRQSAQGQQPATDEGITWDAPVAEARLPKAKSPQRLAAEQIFNEMPWYQQAAVGAGKAFHDVATVFGAEKTDKDIEAPITESTAGFLGNLGGELALTAIPGAGAYNVALRGARALPALTRLGGAAPWLAEGTGLGARVARAAAGGAAAGAAGEGIMRGEPLAGATYGALLGPLGEAAVTGVGRLYRGGKELFAGAEDKLGTMLRQGMGAPRTQQFVNALRDLRNVETLPGERLTVGHAASAMLPEAKVLEETARRSPGAHRLLEIDVQNQLAREAPLEAIAAPAREGIARQGGTVPVSPAAEARTAGTRPIYRQAAPDRVEVPPLLDEMLHGPEVESVFQAGRDKFLQHQAELFGKGRVPPARGTPYDPDTGQFADYSIRELQFIKDEMTGKINRLAASGKREEAYQLDQVRRQLAREMESQSPTFAQATSRYRELSEPVNQGRVAQELLDSLNAPSGQERTNAFLRALREAPQTIRNALGDTRFRQIEQLMTEPQMADINAVRRSLEREAAYTNLHAPEGVLRKIETLPEKLSKNLPPIFSAPMTIFRKALKNIGIQGDREIMDVMNEVVTDPQRLASILERLPVHERSRFANAVRQLTRSQRTAGYTLGAITGQINEENQ